MDPFVAEIRIFTGNFAPTGWALCNGQLMPISQNTALFSLLGTFYGGDGKSTFALPNLQGSAPLGAGQGAGLSDRFLGEQSGVPNVTLIQTEMPAHTHFVRCSDAAADSTSPTGNVWAVSGSRRATINQHTASTVQNTLMNPLALSITGSSFPHNNMPPYLVLNFIIALQGVFPPRS
jgi:microcystin-dependent protein